MPMPLELSPEDLARRLAAGEPLHLVDVRFPEEFELCRLAGALLIPLPELPARADELAALKDRPVVLYCHHGVRSLRAAIFARSLGLDAASLTGGIEAWSLTVDPSVPRY